MIKSIVAVCRGIFRLKGDTDGTLIGNVGDQLKVTGTTATDDAVSKEVLCKLDELIRQMRILNTHMECITEFDNLEEEPGDHPI